MPRIVLIELNPNGHRAVFLELLLRDLARSGSETVLIVPDEISDKIPPHFRTEGCISVCEASRTDSFGALLRQASVSESDVVIVPDGDPYLKAALRHSLKPGSPRFRLVIMQDPQWVIRSWRSVPIQSLLRNIIKQIVLMAVRKWSSKVDLRYLTYPRPAGTAEIQRPDQVQDPVIVDELPRVMRGSPELDGKRRWIGIVGGITPHKNPALVAEAILCLPHEVRETVGLALLGPIARSVRPDVDRIKKMLESRGVPLVIDDRVRSNGEVNADLCRLNIVALAYSTNAPNSTTAKAAYYGVPTIVAGGRQFREFAAAICGNSGVKLRVEDLSDHLLNVLSLESRPESVLFPDPSVYTSALLDL